jgi:transposase
VGTQPRGRRDAVTCIAALTAAGIDPAITFPGALDRGIVNTYIETVLVPCLHPGQIVLLDNRSVHKSAVAIRMIEAAGARVVFLPRYSPDCPPIEQAFAKLKHQRRRQRPRTFDEIVNAAGLAIAAIGARDARHFIAHAGYRFSGPLL